MTTSELLNTFERVSGELVADLEFDRLDIVSSDYG